VIYQVRAYDFQPGKEKIFEEAFAEVLPYRQQCSRLWAYFNIDVGPLHRILHIWPYEDLGDVKRVSDLTQNSGHWPPPRGGEYRVAMQTSFWQPAPYSPELTEAQFGDVYEIVTDTNVVGTRGPTFKVWESHLAERRKLSPLAAAWIAYHGTLSQLIHIWPYQDLAERQRIRAEAERLGLASPIHGNLVKRESVIAVPAPFSPMH
jgi:hypothetical protein